MNKVSILRNCILYILIFVSVFVKGFGQEVVKSIDALNQKQLIPYNLSLEEAEKILLQKNFVIAGANSQLEANRVAQAVAGYKPNPVVTFGIQQLNPARTKSIYSTDSNAAAQGTYTVHIDKLIERGGKRELRTKQASEQLEVTKAQVSDVFRTQIFQLRQAFANAILARDNLILAESTDQQSGQMERLVGARVENGALPAAELYRVKSERLKYTQAVLQAKTGYEQSTHDVLNLLGAQIDDVEKPNVQHDQQLQKSIYHDLSYSREEDLIPNSLIGTSLQVIGTLSTDDITQTLSELKQTALNNRPDIQEANHILAAADYAVKLAQAQRVRDISVGVEYQRSGSDNVLGATTSFPLMLYNNHKAEIAQLQAQYHTAELQLHQMELQVTTDVEKSYQAYLTAKKTLDLYNSETLVQVQKLQSIAAFSFKEGATSLFELLDAQRTSNQVITAYNQARMDYQLSIWQLEQAVGCPLQLHSSTTQQKKEDH